MKKVIRNIFAAVFIIATSGIAITAAVKTIQMKGGFADTEISVRPLYDSVQEDDANLAHLGDVMEMPEEAEPVQDEKTGDADNEADGGDDAGENIKKEDDAEDIPKTEDTAIPDMDDGIETEISGSAGGTVQDSPIENDEPAETTLTESGNAETADETAGLLETETVTATETETALEDLDVKQENSDSYLSMEISTDASAACNAFDFAVYANNYENSNHVEGNIAICNLSADISIWEGDSYIGNLSSGNAAFACSIRDCSVSIPQYNSNGSENKISIQSGQGYKVSIVSGDTVDREFITDNKLTAFGIVNGIPDAISAGMLSCRQISSELYGLEDMDADGILVLNITADELNRNGTEYDKKITESASEGKTVVVNVSDSGDVSVSYSMNAPTVGGGLAYQPWSGNIIWNFGNASSVATGALFGTVLAPSASVYNGGNVVGAVIADSFSQGGEVHQVNYRKGIPDIPEPETEPRPKTGGLSVSKTTIGTDEQKLMQFKFTVALSDTSISGKYGQMEFADGTAAFMLKDGETKTADGLPAGIQYSITEEQGEFLSECGNATGDIMQGGNVAVLFKNTFPEPQTGKLTVQKTVEGTEGGNKESKSFMFTVTLSDNTISGIYGDMTFKDGTAVFMLNDGDSKTASGIPAGISYAVSETPSDKFIATSENQKGVIANGENIQVSFVNTPVPDDSPETGGLSVRKIISDGSDTDSGSSFIFTVTLSDKTINGTYGEMLFRNGTAVFSLKNRESKTAEGLPAGLEYTVSEEPTDNYIAASENETGRINTGGISETVFTNTPKEKPQYGKISVFKTVMGDGGELDRSFVFSMSVSDASLNGMYGGMLFKDGVSVFTLKHNESITAENLPIGIEYSVTEQDVEGYEASIANAKGTIQDSSEIHVYAKNVHVNTEGETGGLIVRKQVRGNAGDVNKKFKFTVTFNDKSINKKYGDMEFVNGVAEFTLRHNEWKEATGIPAGIKYSVTESDADGYIMSCYNETGIIIPHDTKEALFINAKNETISDKDKAEDPKNPEKPRKPDMPDEKAILPNIPKITTETIRTGDSYMLAVILLAVAVLSAVAGSILLSKKKNKNSAINAEDDECSEMPCNATANDETNNIDETETDADERMDENADGCIEAANKQDIGSRITASHISVTPDSMIYKDETQPKKHGQKNIVIPINRKSKTVAVVVGATFLSSMIGYLMGRNKK